MSLFIIVIAWILGMIEGLYLKISIALLILISCFFYFIFWLVIRKKNNKKIYDKKKKRIKAQVILFLTAFLISFTIIQHYENTLKNKYKGLEEANIVGTIISNPKEKEYKTQYILKVESINGDKSYQGTKILLNIKKKNIQYGNKIRFKGNIELPQERRNYRWF